MPARGSACREGRIGESLPLRGKTPTTSRASFFYRTDDDRHPLGMHCGPHRRIISGPHCHEHTRGASIGRWEVIRLALQGVCRQPHPRANTDTESKNFSTHTNTLGITPPCLRFWSMASCADRPSTTQKEGPCPHLSWPNDLPPTDTSTLLPRKKTRGFLDQCQEPTWCYD